MTGRSAAYGASFLVKRTGDPISAEVTHVLVVVFLEWCC